MPSGIYERRSNEERFWSKVKKGPGCWEWASPLVGGGYGQFWINGIIKKSHRVSWELLRSKIPEGLQIDHLCRNRACVNPDHLEPVTPRENIMRGVGISAVNNKKTHCIHGHEFTEENTILMKGETSTSSIRRGCRKCRKNSDIRFKSKNRRQDGKI